MKQRIFLAVCAAIVFLCFATETRASSKFKDASVRFVYDDEGVVPRIEQWTFLKKECGRAFCVSYYADPSEKQNDARRFGAILALEIAYDAQTRYLISRDASNAEGVRLHRLVMKAWNLAAHDGKPDLRSGDRAIFAEKAWYLIPQNLSVAFFDGNSDVQSVTVHYVMRDARGRETIREVYQESIGVLAEIGVKIEDENGRLVIDDSIKLGNPLLYRSRTKIK